MPQILELAGPGWSLRSEKTPLSRAEVPAEIAAATIPAIVPGSVHTDLMAAGLMVDPYLAGNETDLYWTADAGWRYSRIFTLDASLLAQPSVELVCDGLDTVATVYLNGQQVGSSQNMFRRHRFDVKQAAVEGQNTLEIVFEAPLPYAESWRDKIGDLPVQAGANRVKHPYNFIRKMACNFGWDWGPEVVTCGIFRDIRIEAFAARLGDVRPLVTEATADRATVEVHADALGDGELNYALLDPSGNEVSSGVFNSGVGVSPAFIQHHAGETPAPRNNQAVLQVGRPQLWWPVGYGEQSLYTLRVTLSDAAGNVVDTKTHRIGLRTVRLVTQPDATPQPHGQGEGMYVEVNGQRVYARGANWIPDDCFLHRVTPDRYRARLTQARDANMNMLRVWGGGIFEDDAFYDLCDELGLLVWQDCMTACAGYPEAEPFRSEFDAETRDNLSRLARHPSLCLINGCNENLWGWRDWEYGGKSWKEFIGDRPWGLTYYFDVMPKAVADVTPTLPYWPGSPSNGTPDIDERHPNLNEFGNRHVWDVWHGRGQYRNYLEHYPRFSSEFGFHGPPAYPTLAAAIPTEQRQWDSPLMKLHNKNGGDGQAQTHRRMADDFDPPADFDDWLYLAQVMQARALAMGVEWFRALSPWCSGALIWQLNDCYPVSSWSMIDSEGRPKPLYFAARRFFTDRLVTIKPRRVVPVDAEIGELAVYLHNDHGQRWQGTLTLRRMSIDGIVLATVIHEIDVPSRESRHFNVPDSWHDNPAGTFLVADCDGSRGCWWFEPDKQMVYPTPIMKCTLDPAPHGYDLRITAGTLVRDLCVFADRLDADALVSDQCVTLLPDESVTLAISTKAKLTLEDLTRSPVMQCANFFGSKVPV